MNLTEKYQFVSYQNGKFLSDKSYAYDTIYFVTKFISEYSKDGIFDMKKYKSYMYNYISEIFNRENNSSDIGNYCSETLKLLEYSQTIERIGKRKYKIIDFETIKFITLKMENAYIYVYYLSYYTILNAGAMSLYIEFCNSKSNEIKENKLNEINGMLYHVNPSTLSGTNSQWAKQNTKYIVNIMNFINYQPEIARTFKIKPGKIRNPKTISVNVAGSKTKGKKNNNYLEKFDFSYVDNMLKDVIIYKGEEENEFTNNIR